MKLTIHFHLVVRLRMSRVICLLPYIASWPGQEGVTFLPLCYRQARKISNIRTEKIMCRFYTGFHFYLKILSVSQIIWLQMV
jgi:hypothetical protein